MRVIPGRLSLSRCFGDIHAKHPRFGGKPGVLSSEPDISFFKIIDNLDFLILACKLFILLLSK